MTPHPFISSATLRKAAAASGAADASAVFTASSISAVTSDSSSASWASLSSRCSIRYCLSRWNGSFFRHASTSWGVGWRAAARR